MVLSCDAPAATAVRSGEKTDCSPVRQPAVIAAGVPQSRARCAGETIPATAAAVGSSSSRDSVGDGAGGAGRGGGKDRGVVQAAGAAPPAGAVSTRGLR